MDDLKFDLLMKIYTDMLIEHHPLRCGIKSNKKKLNKQYPTQPKKTNIEEKQNENSK